MSDFPELPEDGDPDEPGELDVDPEEFMSKDDAWNDETVDIGEEE